MSENTGSMKLSIPSSNPEGVEDQLDRLNTVIQNFMINLDMSRSHQISCNISNSVYPYCSEEEEEEVSQEIPEQIEYKFEEILQENDRLRMVIEDFASDSLRKNFKISCTVKEIYENIISFKDLILNKKSSSLIKIGNFSLEIKVIDQTLANFPSKSVIRNLFENEFESEYFSKADLLQKIFNLENEVSFLRKFNNSMVYQKEILQNMASKFVIDCENQIIEYPSSAENLAGFKKEAQLKVEINNYQKKNFIMDQVQTEIEWQLNEIKSIKQIFLIKNQEMANLKASLDLKEKKLKEREKEINAIMSRYSSEKKHEGRSKNKNIENFSIIKSNFLTESTVMDIENFEFDLDNTSETPLIPTQNYKLFTVESLTEQLKFLQEKAQNSSQPEKLVREIERCKTQITNLRGEQAIYECKQKTKNMFKIVKNIDKVVKHENQKRTSLIEKFLKEPNEIDKNCIIVKKEIEESLEKSLKRLEEQRLMEKRTSVPFSKKFFQVQENNLIELRTQINVLSKHDEIQKKSFENKKKMLEIKENELKEKEKFIFENWKKHPSVKELMETIQKISNKLNSEKENLKKNKEKFEEEKVEFSKARLENEINRGKLKSIANQLTEERKYLEKEKNEIEKFVKQISSLPSYLGKIKI